MNNKDIQKWNETSSYNHSLMNDSMINSSIKKAKYDIRIHNIKLLSIILIPLLSFTILVNTSQQFVSAMNDVPIVNIIIELFKYNKSIYLARNTDVYQKIDKTYKTDDYTLYIESMVVDEDQIVLYYQVTSDKEIQSAFFTPNDYWPCAANAYNFEMNQLSFMSIDPEEIIELDKFNFTFEVSDIHGKQIGEQLEITIMNDIHKIKKSSIINLNKMISIDNQNIMIEKIEVYPLRTIVYTKEDKNNTMDILELDFSLKTKNGEQIKSIQNGQSAQHYDEYRDAYMLESPYALDNEFELYLNEIRWVEKDKQDLIFNLETKSFEYLPEYIKLNEINEHNMTLRVSGKYNKVYAGLNGLVIYGSGEDKFINKDGYISYSILVKFDNLTFNNHIAIIEDNIGTMKSVDQYIETIDY